LREGDIDERLRNDRDVIDILEDVDEDFADVL
jgi:hypothetical protein